MLRSFLLSLLLVSLPLGAQTIVPDGQREGADHASEALRFIEQMHSVPDGFNWRLVNHAVRQARVERMVKGANQTQNGHITVNGTWRELGSNNVCGRIIAVDHDVSSGRTWVAGAGGTIWAGDVEGSNWTILNETQQIDYPKLIKHVGMPDGTTRLIAVSNQPRSYILDQGETVWKLATGQEEWQRWGNVRRAVACTRSDRLEIYMIGTEWDYGAAWKGRGVLYRSVDSGASYQRLRWFDGAQALWTDGSETVLMIHGDTLSAVEPDGSLSQITISNAWSAGSRSVLIAGTSTAELMLALYDGSKTQFAISYDVGTTWEETGTVEFGPFHAESFTRSADLSQTWLYGGVEAWRGDEVGYEWVKVNNWGAYYGDPETKLHADIPAIVSFPLPNGKGLTFICTDGGIYTSRDGGKTVQNISLHGLNTAQYYGSYTSRDNVDVVGAGAQDQGFQRSLVDDGSGPRDFDQLISGDYARLVSGDDGASLFCVYPGFTLYWPDFENGGARIGQDFVHKNAMWLPPLAVDPRNRLEAILGGGRGGETGTFLYKYRYTGNALAVDSLPHDFSSGGAGTQITAVAISRNAPDNWYVATTAGHVWVSSNAGADWTDKERPKGLDGHYFGGNAFAIDPRFASTVYIGGQGYNAPAVWVSTDAASTWTALEGLPPCLVYGLDVSSDGRLVAAATDAGAFVYDTEEGVWTDVTQLGAPDQTYWHVEWVAPLRQFRFSTYGRGLWAFTPGTFTSVPDQRHTSYRLNVSGVSTPTGGGVRVQPVQAGLITVRWYDVEGRLLQTTTATVGTDASIVGKPASVRQGAMVIVSDGSGRIGAAMVP